MCASVLGWRRFRGRSAESRADEHLVSAALVLSAQSSDVPRVAVGNNRQSRRYLHAGQVEAAPDRTDEL